MEERMKKLLLTIITVGISSAIVACGPSINERVPNAKVVETEVVDQNLPEGPATTPEEKPELVEKQCLLLPELKDINDDEKVMQEDSIHIERHFQMVKRIDCDGTTILSEKVETVVDPKVEYTIKAQDISWYKNVGASEAVVRNTCDSSATDGDAAIRKLLSPSKWLTDDEILIVADLAKAIATTQVEEGENIIDYVFYDDNCTFQMQRMELCEAKPLEVGTLKLNVTFEAKDIPGTKVIQKVCKKEDTI